jgi:hypothetical protein
MWASNLFHCAGSVSANDFPGLAAHAFFEIRSALRADLRTGRVTRSAKGAVDIWTGPSDHF